MFNVGVYLLMICWIVKKITYEDDSLNFPNWKITVKFHETVAFRAMDNTLLARNVLCAISRWIVELTNTHLSKPCLVVELPNYYLQRLLAENLTCPDSRWIVELTNPHLSIFEIFICIDSKRLLTCPDSCWIVELTNLDLASLEKFHI